MNKIITIDLEKLKLKQVNKIYNCILRVIRNDPEYFKNYDFSKKILDNEEEN